MMSDYTLMINWSVPRLQEMWVDGAGGNSTPPPVSSEMLEQEYHYQQHFLWSYSNSDGSLPHTGHRAVDTPSAPEFDNFSILEYLNVTNTTIQGLNVTTNATTVHSIELTVAHIFTILALSTIIICALIGNTLVILAVATNRRLRTVTNCFVVSLAAADFLVSILVMPLTVFVEISNRQWWFGLHLCNLWTSLDVMLCTASILNLCCISLDRYFAITKPLDYSTKRSKKLAMCMVALAWCASALITCPPIFGWQEEGRAKMENVCQLSSNPGYVIYSALGSFFIPLTVMLYVYARIFIIANEREKMLQPYRKSRRKGKAAAGSKSETYLSDSMTTDNPAEKIRLQTPATPRTNKGISGTGAGRAMGNGNKDEVATLRHTFKRRTSSLSDDDDDDDRRGDGGGASDSDSCSITGKSFHSVKRLTTALSAAVALPMTIQNGSPNKQNGGRSQPTATEILKRAYSRHMDTAQRERSIFRRESKAAKTLAIVVGGFVICWLPFFLIYIVAPFCAACHFPQALLSFVTWLGYCNSAMNPFIYAFYNKDFRITFWRLTCGLCLTGRRS